MGSDKLGPTQWRDVPEAVTQSWRSIFHRSTEGLDLDAPVPFVVIEPSIVGSACTNPD